MTPIAIISGVDRILRAKGVSMRCRTHVREALLDVTRPMPEAPAINPAEVCERMALIIGRTPDELRGRSRRTGLRAPRQVCMYILYKEIGGFSKVDIGKHFGGRNHATVINAINKVTVALRRKNSIPKYYYNLYKQQQG